MPVYQASTLPSRPVIGSSLTNSGQVDVPLNKVNIAPVQLLGFVPMYDCSNDECRKIYEKCCHRNIVFGNVISDKAVETSTYENDINTFGVDVQLYDSNPYHTQAHFQIEKCSSTNIWERKVTILSSAYGQYYELNSIPTHKTYSILSLNWGKVLKAFGIGLYRIKYITQMRENILECLVSDTFFLRQFTCQLADKTVKFEITNTGKIGAHYGRGKIFDMCNVTWFDSYRLLGTFGKEKISEYLQEINEYRNGTQVLFKDEAIQKFEFESRLLPKEYHDRLKTYMMMADVTLVSDYNILNPDWNIKQFRIVKDGNYEPEYHDVDQNRNQNVKVIFKAGIQNIIKSLCCSVNGVGGTR